MPKAGATKQASDAPHTTLHAFLRCSPTNMVPNRAVPFQRKKHTTFAKFDR